MERHRSAAAMPSLTEPTVSRRGLLRAVGGAAAATALGASAAGCGAGSGTDGLSFVYMGTAEQQATWKKLFARFTQKHPGIKLKAEGIPLQNWGEFFDKVSTRLAGGQVPDVVQVATEGQRLFASKGLLEPLDPYIAKDKSIIDSYYSDMDPNLIKWNKEHSSIGGRTFYLPGEFNTMCVWYSKELFAKAKVDEPTAGWTWDDFHAACVKIKKATGAYGYAVDAAYFTAIMPWLLTNGTSSFTDDWSKPTFDDPAAIEAAEFNRSLVADKLAPTPGGTFDPFTAMSQGKLAMFGGGRWPIINMRNLHMVDKVGIVPWPKKAAQGSPVGWNGYPILKASTKKKDAWTFVKFLISKEGSAYFAELGGTIVPARRSVATSDDFLNDSPTGTDQLYKALDYGTPIPSPNQGASIQKAIEDTWQQILVGNAKAPAAMRKAQAKLAGLV
ncbi:MAG: sugar ABC transporter substrate-binding protein [Actinocatenispora sp.]